MLKRTNRCSYEWVSVPNGGYHPGYIDRYVPKDYTGDTGPNYDPADFCRWFYEQRQQTEDRIVKNTNNPCVDKIIDRLKQKDLSNLYVVPNIGELSGTGHLSQGIFDLFDKSGFYNLIIEVAEAGYSDGKRMTAKTVKTANANEWKITIDDDYVRNATQLSLARTIIHESVHAFIGYIVNTNRTSDMTMSLQDLYFYYSSNYPEKLTQNLTQHEFMSQYVDAIAVSLSVWDNKRQGMDYYKKLSWAGLESSSAYQSQPNKNEIQKAITDEATNSANARGEECN